MILILYTFFLNPNKFWQFLINLKKKGSALQSYLKKK